MSTLRYAPKVISDAISELNNRQNSINSLTSQVADLTSQVNTLTGQVNTLTGDLNNVYDVIVDNTVGVVVVKENIDHYGVYCQNIITAYNTIVADKDATISARNTTISTYEGYFSDICNNISSMNGTVDDPIVFSKVADYVLTIPQSGSPTAYIGYLNDIYTVISANNQGITVTSGDYQNFDTNIQDIFKSYDATITGKDNTIYSLTSTVNAYEMDFGSIYTAIVNKGGTCTQNDYSTYASGVNSIPTSGGSDTSTLEGYLDDIYDVISKNDVGVTVVEGAYQDYDTNTSAIISALKSQISTLQSQLSTANQTITTYQGYFADIATSITNKGGTVTDQSAYADFDDYVTGIPSGGQAVDQGIIAFGKLKSQINDFDVFGNNNARDNHILVCTGDCENMFRHMGADLNGTILRSTPMYSEVTVNLAGVTNTTNMFGHVTEENGALIVDTYLGELRAIVGGFGVGYNGDLSLDLRCFESVDFDTFKNKIPNNTSGYIREFILRSYNYDQNVEWGGVAKLRQKGYTVTNGGETFP